MDKTATQIFSLLPTSQQEELLEKAVKGLQEKVRVIVSNLPAEKLIVAHNYLTKLASEECTKVQVSASDLQSWPVKSNNGTKPIKNRPPPSYVSTPEDSDVDYSDMPPLIDEAPKKKVKNIYGYRDPFYNVPEPIYFKTHTPNKMI